MSQKGTEELLQNVASYSGRMFNFSALLFLVMGVIFFILGVAGLIWSIQTASAASLGVGITAGTFLFLGIVFFMVGRFMGAFSSTGAFTQIGKLSSMMGRSAPDQEMSGWIRGTAQVLSTQDTGMVLNGVNLVVKARLLVEIPGRGPYEAEARQVMQGRNQWGALQPGMNVPVKVDPADVSKVAIDMYGSSQSSPSAASAAAMTPEMNEAAAGVLSALGLSGMAAQQARVVTKSGADIAEFGVKVTGKLLSASPTGMTAGIAKPGLEADEADDPIMLVAFTYPGPDGRELHSQIMVRVPDRKGHALIAGEPIPIAYLAEAPTTATIDWGSVPGLFT